MRRALLFGVLMLLGACAQGMRDWSSPADGAHSALEVSGERDGGVIDTVPLREASVANDLSPVQPDLSLPAQDAAPNVDATPSPRGWPLNTGWIVAVDSVEGGAILATKDGYLRTTSSFDRSFLTQEVGVVSHDQVAAHLGQKAGDWIPTERTRLQSIVASIDQRMRGYRLPFPAQMFLIKGEHFMPSHTRGAAIYVGSEGLAMDDAQLEELLIHELWHLLSRNDPDLREEVYGVIDYHPCGVVDRPVEIADLWLSNPDAIYKYCITLGYGGYEYDFTPVTYAKEPFSSSTGTAVFDVMEFSFLGVQAGPSASLPLYADGGAGDVFLLSLQSLQMEYMQKVGGNTDYIIHPDEIIADNFAYLFLHKQNLPSPEILQGIDDILRAL